MRRILCIQALVACVLLAWLGLAMPVSAAAQGGSISGRVAFNTGQAVPEGTVVKLVNGSNQSDYIPGFNVTPGEGGFFQLTNVSSGFYKVYAWSPYYTEGYSEGLYIASNDTYTASVVLLAMPYYANMTAVPKHVTYGNSADITVQVADYWGRPVGAGWQILLRTTVGTLQPDSAYTDADGRAYSVLPWEDNRTPAEITAFAIATNGSSYGLEENVDVAEATPAPTAVPTASPAATATPTPVPTVAPTAPSPSPTATPSSGTGSALVGMVIALAMLMAIKKSR